jgi:hypothetical protein
MVIIRIVDISGVCSLMIIRIVDTWRFRALGISSFRILVFWNYVSEL